MLHLDPADIRQTRILDPHLNRIHEDDKPGILDVRILMNDDTEIDTEIQLSELRAWAGRALFYISKMYTEQIGKGQKYDMLKKCVSISILDFILFKDEPEFYSQFHIREDTRHFIYTDRMEFHVIELPKLPGELHEDCSSIKLWAKFISAEEKEVFDMIAEKDPYIKSAYDQLQAVSLDSQKRLEYEAREKAIRDHSQLIFEAELRGEERINERHALLIQNDRFDDLKRSIDDPACRHQLMDEYGL